MKLVSPVDNGVCELWLLAEGSGEVKLTFEHGVMPSPLDKTATPVIGSMHCQIFALVTLQSETLQGIPNGELTL